MSLILDALQRSEQESEQGSQAPGLPIREDPIVPAGAGSGKLWFIVAALLLLLTLALTWWGLYGAAEEDSWVEAEPAVEPEAELEPIAVAPVVANRATLQPTHDFAEVAALYEQLSSAQPAAAEPTLQAELEAAPVQSHPAPLIVDLSQRIKDQIPSIFFRQHDWSPTPATSSVHLNGGVYRVGDTVAPGLRLVEILQDAIVLDYRGEEFRLRALNSWVNL